MKRYWLITLVLCVVGVTTVLAVRYWPRIVHPGEPSGLYLRYKDNPHISAAFIKDFRVNDSLTLDVTILEARDSVGWDQMKNDFKIKPLPSNIEKVLAEKNAISHHHVPKDTPDATLDTIDLLNNDHMVIKHKTQTFYIFQSRSKAQNHQIIDKFFHEVSHQKVKK